MDALITDAMQGDTNAFGELYRMLAPRIHRFARFESGARFGLDFDELRQCFRVRRRGGPHVPLPDQRRLFLARRHGLIAGMATG